MDNLFSWLNPSYWFQKKTKKVLFLGLDAAGKTTIFYKMRLGDLILSPSIGFQVETLEYKNIKFTCWDVGGQERIRPLWHHYFPSTNALVFVIDSNDRERIGEAREELFRLLQEVELEEVPLLIFANKQDLPNAMSVLEITEELTLFNLTRDWYIQESCATQGDGLFEGFRWLDSALKGEAINLPPIALRTRNIKGAK